MRQISPAHLHAWLEEARRGEREPPLLLDVREPWEYALCHLAEAKLLPMRDVPARLQEIDKARETVVICHHGARSFQVGMFLEQQGHDKVINLNGGLAAWARDVDPAMPTY